MQLRASVLGFLQSNFNFTTSRISRKKHKIYNIKTTKFLKGKTASLSCSWKAKENNLTTSTKLKVLMREKALTKKPKKKNPKQESSSSDEITRRKDKTLTFRVETVQKPEGEHVPRDERRVQERQVPERTTRRYFAPEP